MTESFDVTELVGLFREALLPLLPVMDKSRIEWREGRTYDPWENIERTLYHSIIGSCVDESVEPRLKTLAKYGLSYPSYADHSFLVSSDKTNAAFIELGTGSEPFDEAIFVEFDSDLKPSSNSFRRTLAGTNFMIATPETGTQLAFHRRITYET